MDLSAYFLRRRALALPSHACQWTGTGFTQTGTLVEGNHTSEPKGADSVYFRTDGGQTGLIARFSFISLTVQEYAVVGFYPLGVTDTSYQNAYVAFDTNPYVLYLLKNGGSGGAIAAQFGVDPAAEERQIIEVVEDGGDVYARFYKETSYIGQFQMAPGAYYAGFHLLSGTGNSADLPGFKDATLTAQTLYPR